MMGKKKKPKSTIERDELLNIKRGVRREIDVQDGVGINRRHNVEKDKKKAGNKDQCRSKVKEDK